MKSILSLTWVAVLLLVGGYAHSEITDVQVHQDGELTTVEVLFHAPIRLASARPKEATGQLRIALVPGRLDDFDGWGTQKIAFDEPDHALASITVEQNADNDLHLILNTRREMYVEILPQYTQRHVLFTLSSPGDRRRLAKSLKSGRLSRYALFLEERPHSLPTLSEIPQLLAREHAVYVADSDREDRHRLMVGFWDSERDALAARAKVLGEFPDTVVTRVSKGEEAYGEFYRLNPQLALARIVDLEPSDGHVRVRASAMTPSSMGRSAVTPVKAAEWIRRSKSEKTHPLMEKADEAFASRDYPRAILLYTRIRDEASGEPQAQAHERLGISRELNGQLAHATKLYRDYLATYTPSDGARRVKLRLDSLAALTAEPSKTRRRPKKKEDWTANHSVSQFYRRHSLTIDGHETIPIDGVFTDATSLIRKSGETLDHESRLSITHVLDLGGNLGDRDIRVSAAYWDSYLTKLSTGIRIGRQSKYAAGVIGRFDGATLRHQFSDQVEIGAVGGFLLDSSFDAPSTDRPVYGLYGTFRSHSGTFSISPFVVQQKYEGVLDRQAVGLQMHWLRQSSMLVGLLDYDFYHGALNNITINANLGMDRPSSFNLSFNQRRSPYITTRNALIGQPFDDLDELERELIDLSLKGLADDRTATSRNIRAGWNHKFDKHWEISSDVGASQFSSTNSSMNVVGFDSRKSMYYSTQVRAIDPFGANSYSAIMLRHNDGDRSAVTSLYWNNRFKIGEQTWLYPRFRFDHRSFDTSGQTQQSWIPSLRLDYRWKKQLRFEFEAGYQITNRETNADDIEIEGLFFRAGYRAVF